MTAKLTVLKATNNKGSKYKPTAAQIQTASTHLTRTGCCGLYFFNGLGVVSSPIMARAIQRAAGVAVIATSTSDTIEAVEHLKAAGFIPVAKFRNPNTSNMVTVWMAAGSRMRSSMEIFTKIEGVNDDGSSEEGVEAKTKPRKRARSAAASS